MTAPTLHYPLDPVEWDTFLVAVEDAIRQGIDRANKTLRQVRSVWIKEQYVRVENGKPSEYQVNMMVTFIIDD